MRPNVLVITCEHGGNDVPDAYVALFADCEELLASHRGWDLGAFELARRMADAFGLPLHAATTTRLLVDLNRSIGHRQLFSDQTRALSRDRRQVILDHHYLPHRAEVENAVARHIGARKRVIHVASHSFTPVLDGVERRADVAWLYDPRRRGEVVFAREWLQNFDRQARSLRLRRNYPYQGRADGLTALLRRRHPDAEYVGIELEVNQRFFAAGGPPWDSLQTGLIESLGLTLARAFDGYGASA